MKNVEDGKADYKEILRGVLIEMLSIRHAKMELSEAK